MVRRKEGEEVRAEQASISFANFDLIDLIYLAGFSYYIHGKNHVFTDRKHLTLQGREALVRVKPDVLQWSV